MFFLRSLLTPNVHMYFYLQIGHIQLFSPYVLIQQNIIKHTYVLYQSTKIKLCILFSQQCN